MPQCEEDVTGKTAPGSLLRCRAKFLLFGQGVDWLNKYLINRTVFYIASSILLPYDL